MLRVIVLEDLFFIPPMSTLVRFGVQGGIKGIMST